MSENALSPYRRTVPQLDEDPWPAALPDDGAVPLLEFWRVLVKHRQWIAAIFLVCVISTAVVNLTMDPLYTATVTIQIDRQPPKIAPVQEVQEIESPVYDRYDYYETQFQLLESRLIAARVIRTLQLERDERFAGRRSAGLREAATRWVRSLLPASRLSSGEGSGELGVDPAWIDRYLGMLSVRPVRGSRLVRTSFTSRSAELSAEVANQHVAEYVDAFIERRAAVTQKAKEFLDGELAKARDRVIAAEAEIARFRKEKGIVSLSGGATDIVSSRLGDLNQRFTETQAERIRLESQMQLIETRAYESLPEVASNLMIQEMKQEAAKIEAERAELEKTFEPEYPKLAGVIARERQIHARIASEVEKIVETIRSAYLAAKSREQGLAAQLEAQRRLALEQKDVSGEHDTLARDVETARGLYNSLLQRLQDVDVAGELKVSNVSVVAPAIPPLVPSRPRKLLNLALAVGLGLALGVALAFLLEYVDTSLKTPEDVRRVLGLPTLGVVPSYDAPVEASSAGAIPRLPAPQIELPLAARRNGERKAAGAARTTRFLVIEAYRTIRTALLLSNAEAPPQVILFTSGAAQEGKTLTALNEAMALARGGANVLVIDADIRKPRVHRILDVPNGQGLSTYLAGQSSLESVIHDVPLGPSARSPDGPAPAVERGALPRGRLLVVPSGPPPPDPAELLGSRRMRETLELLRGEHDHIIIDTPPLLPVTDAVLLAAMSDAVVMVVRGQKTPGSVVARARERLGFSRARIVGVVLNDVDVSSADYRYDHRYSYSYYSSYAADPPLLDRPAE